jgi:hypothetical protein
MSRLNSPPFARGTFAGPQLDGGLEFPHLEGREFVFEDINPNPNGGANGQRTGEYVTCRLVRNVSGATLLPKRLVKFDTTAGRYGSRVIGYSTLTAESSYPIDEYLPATGVPNNALFYIVVSGPALVLTDLAGGANNVFTVGQLLVALTAATTGATTAGRVAPIDLTGATAALGGQIIGRLGRALTARTTGNTNADLLVDITRF